MQAMKCPSTTVEPRTDLSQASGWINAEYIPKVQHAGTITHQCEQEDHSLDVECKCTCGYSWTRNYKTTPY